MQPSPSLVSPRSSASSSATPAPGIVVPGGHSAAGWPPPAAGGAVEPLLVVPPPPEVVELLLEDDELVAGAAATGADAATPTPIRPFIPAAAWPLTSQRYSYFPLFVSFTVRVAVSPWWSSFVTSPTHAFFVRLVTGTVQSLNVWNATPWFVTLKMIVPTGRLENFDSLKASSLGLPAVTVTTATPAAPFVSTFAEAEPTAKNTASTVRQDTPRTTLNERVRCIERAHPFRETFVTREPAMLIDRKKRRAAQSARLVDRSSAFGTRCSRRRR